jgi:hypothetical protein
VFLDKKLPKQLYQNKNCGNGGGCKSRYHMATTEIKTTIQ